MHGNRAETKVVHVNPEISGRPDGVEAITSCVLTRFRVDPCGKPIKLKAFPERHECKMMASHSNGTVSLSIQGIGEMVTVQLEDLESLLRTADCVSTTESLR
jgi:hypothetical protein